MNALSTWAAALGTACLIGPFSNATAASPRDRHIEIREERFAQLGQEEQQRVLDLKDRMERLLAIDSKHITAAERRQMRHEWRDMRSEMQALNRGGTVIYISGGGLLLLIILLIILL